MSYDTGIKNGGVYTGLNNEAAAVNTVPDYNTLGTYYTSQCPYQTVPGGSPVNCVSISPVYGGVGYTVLQNNLPGSQLTDNGYFSLQNAYPSFPNTFALRPYINY